MVSDSGKIGATKIAEAVVACMFPIPRNICVANVSWSLLPYEADLLVLTGSGYLVEVETKITLADLKRDAAKKKWETRAFAEKVSRFYYAMPEKLWDKPAAKEAVRPGAGVIVVRPGEMGLSAVEVVPAVRRHARPLSAAEQFNLARVGSFRAWGAQQKHRLRQLRAERELLEKQKEARWQDWLAEHKARQALTGEVGESVGKEP